MPEIRRHPSLPQMVNLQQANFQEWVATYANGTVERFWQGTQRYYEIMTSVADPRLFNIEVSSPGPWVVKITFDVEGDVREAVAALEAGLGVFGIMQYRHELEPRAMARRLLH